MKKIKEWFNNLFASKHIHIEEVYRDYPDRYIKYLCLDCGETIFED